MNRTDVDVVIKPSLFSTSFSAANASDGLELTKDGSFY
jgi:hypothetical protein